MGHKVYRAIVNSVNAGILHEPFSTQDFRKHCPGFKNGTYNAFLYKHKKGNRQGNSELFIQVGVNQFILIRPLKYGY